MRLEVEAIRGTVKFYAMAKRIICLATIAAGLVFSVQSAAMCRLRMEAVRL